MESLVVHVHPFFTQGWEVAPMAIKLSCMAKLGGYLRSMLDKHMLQMLDWALEEDLGAGDCTSKSSVPAGWCTKASFGQEEGVVAGIEVAEEVFRRVDPSVTLKRSSRTAVW